MKKKKLKELSQSVEEMQYIKLIIITISTFFTTLSWAQVTIGLGEAPTKTAILQIKDQPVDANNITSKSGGLLLPRVGLINLKTLQPFVQPSNEEYEKDKKLSIGLLVYNMTYIQNDSIFPGLYYWDGEEWDKVSIGGGNGSSVKPPIEPTIPTSPQDPDALKLSNCYILDPGETAEIPVVKGYAVWYQMLNANEVSDLSGAISVELLWQDTPGLIETLEIEEDKGPASLFKVKVANGRMGNAVVALKIEGVIYWSWHLWITGYTPEDESDINYYNGLAFMDRNLGATNDTPGSLSSKGLLYQWGRKDPFPGSSTVTDEDEKILYSMVSGVNPVIEKVDINTLTPVANNYVRASINNPATFFYTSNALGDWYADDITYKNDFLWSNLNDTKGIYDPCPPGWRAAYGDSPWADVPIPGAMVLGTGVDFGDAGYYPAAGYREGTSGTLLQVGDEGYVWNATVASVERNAYSLYFKGYVALPKELSPKTNAYSVRCVQE